MFTVTGKESAFADADEREVSTAVAEEPGAITSVGTGKVPVHPEGTEGESENVEAEQLELSLLVTERVYVSGTPASADSVDGESETVGALAEHDTTAAGFTTCVAEKLRVCVEEAISVTAPVIEYEPGVELTNDREVSVAEPEAPGLSTSVGTDNVPVQPDGIVLFRPNVVAEQVLLSAFVTDNV